MRTREGERPAPPGPPRVPTPGLPPLGAGASACGGPGTCRGAPRGPRGQAGTLTRRRRGEAACSPSAECPSPWPRGFRGPQPRPGAAGVRRLEGCARWPASRLSGSRRHRLHARAPLQPAPWVRAHRGVAAGASPASAARAL